LAVEETYEASLELLLPASAGFLLPLIFNPEVELSVDFQRNIRRYFSKDRIHHGRR
jgi:hypothetical protein